MGSQMQLVVNLLHSRMKHHLDRYDGVLVLLEAAFGQYESRQISINGYLDTVCAIDQRVRQQRPLWLQLCDWSLALRWLNSAERRAFNETCDALDWCRNWAIRQRGVDVATCLESATAHADANANGDYDFVPSLGLAA